MGIFASALTAILISVFRNPSFAKQLPPIYWLLPIWAEASGITFLYIHQWLRRLRFASLASPSTLTLISELRIGLLIFVYLEVAFVLGCLVIYPQAVPFFIGTVFIGPKAISADRADLWLLEEQVRRNIASAA